MLSVFTRGTVCVRVCSCVHHGSRLLCYLQEILSNMLIASIISPIFGNSYKVAASNKK